MLNVFWVAMLVMAIVCGAFKGTLAAVTQALITSAGAAVTLAIGLIGVMAFFLGLMRIVQEGGLLKMIARGLRPVMIRLFPDVPAEHPAMSMMILNISANMLGLGNAATPFGLKAMMALDTLNPKKGTATPAMALFLAINTSGVTLLPTGIIALRASLGSTAPASILIPTLFATLISTTVAIIACKVLSRFWVHENDLVGAGNAGVGHAIADVTAAEKTSATDGGADSDLESPFRVQHMSRAHRTTGWTLLAVLVVCAVYAVAQSAYSEGPEGHLIGWLGALEIALRDWMLLVVVMGFVMFGVLRGVKIYDAMVEGAKEGFDVALRIIPYLVTILVAIGMLRASGAIDAMVDGLAPFTSLIGMPAETLPMALLRPLSGSGAYAVATEIMQTRGPDSLVGQIVATMQGSTETTFYVLALYFGVVRVRQGLYTLPACLLADVAGLLGSVWMCRLLLY